MPFPLQRICCNRAVPNQVFIKLILAKTKLAKSKYQELDIKRQRWNGKGNKTQWVIDFETNGANLEDILFGKKDASVPT
jgi:hypothetical protein